MLLTAKTDRRKLTPLDQNVERSPSIPTLPEELHELVRAGISNAIERAISDQLIPSLEEHERFESAISEQIMFPHKVREYFEEIFENLFLDEICGPCPQIKDFIRKHEFTSFLKYPKKHYRKNNLQYFYRSDTLEDEQRQYEQDVYDFSRNLGLSVNEAENWVLKAREFFSEKDYGSTDTESSDIANSSDEMLDQSFGLSSPEKFRSPLMPVEHSDQAPYDASSPDSPSNLLPESVSMSVSGPSQALTLEGVSTSNSKDAIEDVGQITAESKIKSAKQLQQCQLQTLKDPDRRSEDPQIQPTTRTLPDPSDERPVDNISNDGRDTNEIERVVNEKEEKAAKKAAKNARKAKLKAEKEAKRQLEKKKSRDGEHEHTDSPEGQLKMISNSEELLQSERLEEKEKPQKQKEKGRKRQRDHDVLPQSDVQSGEHHKHKKSRVDSDAQGDVSSKIKRKKTGPQSSPFFKRSSGIKAKRKDDKKAEAKTDFSSPMIQ